MGIDDQIQPYTQEQTIIDPNFDCLGAIQPAKSKHPVQVRSTREDKGEERQNDETHTSPKAPSQTKAPNQLVRMSEVKSCLLKKRSHVEAFSKAYGSGMTGSRLELIGKKRRNLPDINRPR